MVVKACEAVLSISYSENMQVVFNTYIPNFHTRLLGECEGVYISFVYKNEVNKD